MEFKRASKQLPPVGIYHATYNGDHIIFQVHDGGFRVVNYHGEKDDSPQLHLVKWLDESESNQPSPPEQVGKEAIEFAQFIADNYFSYDDDYWWQNKTHYTTSELYKLFNQKWAEQGKPVVQEIYDDLMKRYNDERYSIQRRSCYYDLAKDIAHKYGAKWVEQGKQESPGDESKTTCEICGDTDRCAEYQQEGSCDNVKPKIPTPGQQSIERLATKLWDKWVLSYEGRTFMTKDLFTLAIQDIIPAKDKTNEAGERK